MTVRPGDFAVVCGTPGEAFRVRNFGAALIEVVTQGPAYHALIAVSPTQAIEARPHGAGCVDIANYGNALVWSTADLDPADRGHLVAAAESFVGTPYGWGDDLAIGLAALHIRFGWVRSKLDDPSTVICSQLVAECYVKAGIPLAVKDPAMVTPNDLRDVILGFNVPAWR